MSSEIDLARGWLVKAASDISAARLVLEGDGPYDTACFHAQQAIEKALKGFLALQRQPIPRTHDLDELQVACLALGPLPWLMMSELFPTNLRGRAVSLTTAFLWLTIFSGAQLFPIITGYSERLTGSVGGAFLLFSVVCIFSFLFGLFMLPETKGRVLEEIAASWKKK